MYAYSILCKIAYQFFSSSNLKSSGFINRCFNEATTSCHFYVVSLMDFVSSWIDARARPCVCVCVSVCLCVCVSVCVGVCV